MADSPATAAGTRREHDTFGPIDVPARRLWGAQTQRSLHHFAISTETLPPDFLAALAMVKRAAATANRELGGLSLEIAGAVERAADEVIDGLHGDEFPLSVWQTGSGTQTNMNMNEVLANRASELLGGARGAERLVHPNDHVNRSQSSNDVFPTAMHVAAVVAVSERLLPALDGLRATLDAKSEEFAEVVKIGRTHLQDATPLTLGQEISGWVAQCDHARGAIVRLAARASRAGDRWHGGGDGAQRPAAVRHAGGKRTRPHDGAAVRRLGKPFRGAGLSRPARGGTRRVEDAGRGGDEDRQRRALAGERPPRGPGRTAHSRERAGQLDHAGQGEPDTERGRHDALRAGARQRCHDRHCRRVRAISS